MAEAKCFNHPNRDAFVRCKKCLKPLCYECRINTEIGVFCSDKCYQDTKRFIERSELLESERTKSSYWKRKTVSIIIWLIILGGLIWFIFYGRGLAIILGLVSNLIEWISSFFSR